MDRERLNGVEVLETLLDVAVEAGEVERVDEICRTFEIFYEQLVDYMDGLSGKTLGHHVFSPGEALSGADEMREGYIKSRDQYKNGSDFYEDLIHKTWSNR
jgi:hypothetical protein